MFEFDRFMAGEHAIAVYNRTQFDQFRAWATRHSLTWQNGCDPSVEALSPTADGTLVNNTNVRRYVPTRTCVYLVVNGHLAQRQRRYTYGRNITCYDWSSLPDETQVDPDGFEVENF